MMNSPAVTGEADNRDGAAGETNEGVNAPNGDAQQPEEALGDGSQAIGGLSAVAALDGAGVALRGGNGGWSASGGGDEGHGEGEGSGEGLELHLRLRNGVWRKGLRGVVEEAEYWTEGYCSSEEFG
jgi:hypothetical protein